MRLITWVHPKRRLQAAQWDFDLAKKSLNRAVKISNAKDDKPHAPAVAATTANGSDSLNAVDPPGRHLSGRCVEGKCFATPEATG